MEVNSPACGQVLRAFKDRFKRNVYTEAHGRSLMIRFITWLQTDASSRYFRTSGSAVLTLFLSELFGLSWVSSGQHHRCRISFL